MAWLSSKKDAKIVGVLKSAQREDDRRNNDLWLALRTAFDEIQEKKSTSQSFNKLYANAYAMVTRNEGERLYRGLCKAVTDHLTTKVRPLVLAKVGDGFLQTLNKAWEDHQTSMALINDIVKYMDRVYAPQSNADSVKKMGMLLFRDEVARYADVRDHLRETMLGLVKTEREGKPVDRLSLKKTCEMLLVLGLNSRSVYEEDFEKPFLAESARFYALRGQHYIKTKQVFEYIAQVEQHISEESERAKQCLDASTVVPIVQVVKKELIGKYMKAIADIEDSGFERMLKNRMTENLAQLLRLVKYVQGDVDTLLDCINKHLRSQGGFIGNEQEDSASLIPKVMNLGDRFDHFLERSFNGDQLAKQTIATDFEYVLSLASDTRKLPMHRSAFVDGMMRQGIRNMTKQEIEELLDKVIETFRSMQEKELCKCYYKQHLAKRLLFNKSASDEAKRTMVAKLRSECGYLFSSRIEAMLNDRRISNDMMQQFKEAYGNDLDGVDINVHVLKTSFWHAAMQHFRRLMECFTNIETVLSGEERRPTTHPTATARLGAHERRLLQAGKEGAIYVPYGMQIDRRASVKNLHPRGDDVPDVRVDTFQRTRRDIARRHCLRDERPQNKPGSCTEFAQHGQSLRDGSYQDA
ncbi:cullin-3-like [Rhipicephalus sanguineus]|uniref:Cullin family profile domain-containing protein n=1 Tax=Rhipicephalus sanguineus TaxID=34632 RepID=A0A9D4QJI0_RHISA|nr:cullin-3-like [Rhipicephalus sanguineus]KAH7982960.1 hypothetical protein HPB52_008385 [Rhipicephalus sanguineus]